jgi:hypothetical protein
MILSQKHKILFVANPKTATTSVQKWLLKEDVSFNKTAHELNGKHIILEEHITAETAREKLGIEYYEILFVFGFCREPSSKLISSYFFYKQAGKNRKLWDLGTKVVSARIKNFFQYLSAKLLPLNIWLLVYPYKAQYPYFTDSSGNVIVGNIGRFENLKNDLERMLKKQKIQVDFDNLTVVNKSDKAEISLNPFLIKVLKLRHRRFRDDIIFYEKVKSQWVNY